MCVDKEEQYKVLTSIASDSDLRDMMYSEARLRMRPLGARELPARSGRESRRRWKLDLRSSRRTLR